MNSDDEMVGFGCLMFVLGILVAVAGVWAHFHVVIR